ncbi:hypothetical protein Q5H93_15135 [Hymenobacter sp. ASUV-10]|uniref:Uncharacterized protein n=1 Tax=Hymenobacter aranciens TaxID=3063996 RepID=A0ABT9BCZ5_9BACT|nr:hypothetical protein [Hymenobacter sp. ASUV-10]MDO7876077.1 hypothetical protein [Hymenobacter sp. ASUV-10]
MKSFLTSCFFFLLLVAATAQADPTNPMALNLEQAKVELDDVSRQLTTALLLQPHQEAILHRSIARELRAFTALQARPEQGTAPAPGTISSFERSITEILTPSQLSTFEKLKTTTPLGEKLQSALFLHQ